MIDTGFMLFGSTCYLIIPVGSKSFNTFYTRSNLTPRDVEVLSWSLQPAASCPAVSVLSRVRLLATPWTVARQAPLSMGSSRQEYRSGLPFPFPNRCVMISYCCSNSLTTLRVQFSNKYVHIVVQPISRTFSSSKLKLYTHQTTTFHCLFPLPTDNNHSTSFLKCTI